MSALSIQVPFPVFQDRDGQPLENGYIWLGVANLNPQTNPVVAYFDEALTIPAAQPLRTLNGYISNAGTPAQVYVDAVNFSILVQDSKGSMVYNFADGTGISPDACGVIYDPPFAGAVSYPVCEVLEQTVSVKDFGAVGDGVADDTVAFESAVAYSNASNVGIYVPAGTYNIDSIAILDNVSIIGENTNNCTIYLQDGNNGAIFNAADQDNITVENLTFDYNPVNNPGPPASGDALSAIVVGSYANIKNCKFVGCISYAVIGYGSYNKVYYCEFTKGAYTQRGACTWFTANTGANYNEICYNTASGLKFGFLVEQASGGSVCTNNVFANNQVTDLVLETGTEGAAPAAAYNAWGCNRTTISNNTATNCTGPAIRLIASSSGSIVTGNNCLNVGSGSLDTTATAGIDIGDSAAYEDDNLIISNNVVIGTGGPGFWFTSVYNSVIDGNVSNNNGITLNPPAAWVTDFYETGFTLASEGDSATTPVANNTFTNNVATGNTYAVTRLGSTTGVIKENIYVGNMFDGNFTTSFDTFPNSDIYVGNTGQDEANKVYSYQRNYGFGGFEAATLTNLYDNTKLMTGFTNAFGSNPGVSIQSTDSLGFAIGATFGDANRKVILRDTGAFNYVPQAEPATAQAGDVYYDSTSNKLRCYNGTSWNNLF
jgi:parallel beta-helix repeat protein